MIAREELRRSLEGILDLERLLSRVTLETANPRDVLAWRRPSAKLPSVRASLSRIRRRTTADATHAMDELGRLALAHSLDS